MYTWWCKYFNPSLAHAVYMVVQYFNPSLAHAVYMVVQYFNPSLAVLYTWWCILQS